MSDNKYSEFSSAELIQLPLAKDEENSAPKKLVTTSVDKAEPLVSDNPKKRRRLRDTDASREEKVIKPSSKVQKDLENISQGV
jgi:hypothetical protein